MNLLQWVPFIIAAIAILIKVGVATSRPLRVGELITVVSFGVYAVVVCYLTLTPTSYAFGAVPTTQPVWIGPVPVNPYLFNDNSLGFYLNMLMLFPLGIYTALTTRWARRRVFFVGLLVSIGIEATQFVLDWVIGLSRWVDINDVLTNLAGFLVGYLLVALLRRTWLRRFVEWFRVRRNL